MELMVHSVDEQRMMLQGIGSRFDFHVCKTLCDLRYVNRSVDTSMLTVHLVEPLRYLISSSTTQTQHPRCMT